MESQSAHEKDILMSSLKSKMMAICLFGCGLLAVMAISHSVHAGGECASLGGACDEDGWDLMQKLEEIGNPTSSQPQTPTKWPAKSRTVRWNQSVSGFEEENNAAENIKTAEAPKTAQNAIPAENAVAQASIKRSDETGIVCQSKSCPFYKCWNKPDSESWFSKLTMYMAL